MKSVKNVIISVVMVAVLLVGGAFAYLTDTETVTNVLTIGEVDIELTEPSFDEDEAKGLYAGQTVSKDPTVKNVGTNDAYVYLMITVPKANVVTADATGEKQNAVVQDLFTYDVNQNWTLLESDESDATTNRYLYAYDSALVKNASTTALFDEVTLINVIEGQLGATTEFEIIVDAYAIQSDFTDAKTPAQAWQLCVEQNEFTF